MCGCGILVACRDVLQHEKALAVRRNAVVEHVARGGYDSNSLAEVPARNVAPLVESATVRTP